MSKCDYEFKKRKHNHGPVLMYVFSFMIIFVFSILSQFHTEKNQKICTSISKISVKCKVVKIKMIDITISTNQFEMDNCVMRLMIIKNLKVQISTNSFKASLCYYKNQ